MARDAARKRELGEQFLHSGFIGRNIRINLAVGSFEIGIRDQPGTAMTGAGDVDHVEVVFLDDPVKVNVNEIQTGRRPPVTEKTRFDVILCERLLEQRIVVEINLTDRQVVGRPPVRVDQCPFLIGQRARHDCLPDHNDTCGVTPLSIFVW